MRIKRFDTYTMLAELENDIDEFSKTVDITDVKYQNVVVNGETMFTAVVCYEEKK